MTVMFQHHHRIVHGWTFLILFPSMMWAIIVSVSRLYDNRHHPLDVIVGMVIGTLMASVFYIFTVPNIEIERFSRRKQQ